MRDVMVELKQLRLHGMAGAWGDLVEQGAGGGAGLDSSRWLIEHLLTVAALGLAWLSWRFVEQPFRRRPVPALPTRVRLFLPTGAVSAAMIVFGFVVQRTDRFDQRTEFAADPGTVWTSAMLRAWSLTATPGDDRLIGWSNAGPARLALSRPPVAVVDRDGGELAPPGGPEVVLGCRPLYFHLGPER